MGWIFILFFNTHLQPLPLAVAMVGLPARLGELEVQCFIQPLYGVPCRGGSLWPAHLGGLDLYFVFQHPSLAIVTCSDNGGFTHPSRRVGDVVFLPAPAWSPMQRWVLVACSSRRVGSLCYSSTPISSHCHLLRQWRVSTHLGELEVWCIFQPLHGVPCRGGSL